MSEPGERVEPLGSCFIRYYANRDGSVHVDIFREQHYTNKDDVLYCERLD